MGRASFIMRLFHVVRQSMDSFAWGVMKRLKEAERRKRPTGWRNKTWMMHHDNAPVHTSLLVHKHLVKHETTVVPQPAFFSRFGPCRLLFVPKVEVHCERRYRRKFATVRTRYPEKRIPELQKTLYAVYRQWKGVLRRQVLLVVGLSINVLKRKFGFFLDRPRKVHGWKGVINQWRLEP
jgi:hypothetical protein